MSARRCAGVDRWTGGSDLTRPDYRTGPFAKITRPQVRTGEPLGTSSALQRAGWTEPAPRGSGACRGFAVRRLARAVVRVVRRRLADSHLTSPVFTQCFGPPPFAC